MTVHSEAERQLRKITTSSHRSSCIVTNSTNSPGQLCFEQRVWTLTAHAFLLSCHQDQHRRHSRRWCSSCPNPQWQDRCFDREDSPNSTRASSPCYETVVAAVLGQEGVLEGIVGLFAVSTATSQLLALFCATAKDYQHCSSALSYRREVSFQAQHGNEKGERLTWTGPCIGCGAGASAGCMLT